QDLRLQLVRVLVLVDQNMIEIRPDVLREPRLGHHHVPVEKQIIVVEEVVALFLSYIAPEQTGEVTLPLQAPRKLLLQRLFQRALGVYREGINLETRFLPRKTLLLARETQLLAQSVEEIGRVGPVDHTELRVELQVPRVVTQQAVAYGVKGSR